MKISPPLSEAQLVERACALAGLSLGEIAARHEIAVPNSLRKAKGWPGELLEKVLGATAQSRPVPDFEALGVELKTLPLNAKLRPKESTYVSVVPVVKTAGLRWEDSSVRAKLRRVLWIPMEADPIRAVGDRRIGQPLLWSPSAADEATLRADWEEHMELITIGRLDEIDARQGTYLQIRPKAFNRRALTPTTAHDGSPDVTLPRGFYLRPVFTARILATTLRLDNRD